MHDRTRLSPGTLEKMRDELVEVISRYVEIDKQALELNLESESNTIALVANIPIRSRDSGDDQTPGSGRGATSRRTLRV
ncbi:MAG: cell division topological specificity factor MinE [Vampirovibrionales bacterium]|nr:cell division topological specificity factor MinE [Vampirovibrionales bacterium]